MKKFLFFILFLFFIGGIFFLAFFASFFARKNLPMFQNNSPVTPQGASSPTPSSTPLSRNLTGLPLKIPNGFSIDIFAKNLKNPRDLTLDNSEEYLLVSVPSEGKVLALKDTDKNGKVDEVITLLKGLNRPHGIASVCLTQSDIAQKNENTVGMPYCFGKIFVAESHQVVSYDYFLGEDRKPTAKNPKKLFGLPNGGNHFTRSLLFIKDENGKNKLLTSVGSSCNVCREQDSRRASILVSFPDGSDLKTYARGLRNSVFMEIHPNTKKIWATEMGRDLLGDNLPPDEINMIVEGKNYGWPICYGKNIHDKNFDENVVYKRNPCMEPYETPSSIDIPAHSAPLGLAFFPESGWDEFNDDLLVAYHGSWNRTEKTGYKIVRYQLNQNGTYLQGEDFITGWLDQDTVLGRPVDILIASDGIIYISDDKAGVIYIMQRI